MPSAATQTPALSVVVATYNRCARLERLLSALAAQRGIRPFEVIVSDDASDDDTPVRLRRLRGKLPFDLRVVATTVNMGPAAARNRGWRAAQSDRVVFTDDDVVPDPGWLIALVRGFRDADVVVGRTRPPKDQRSRIGPFSHHLDMGHDGRFSTCNVAYRRAVLEKLDGFDEAAFRYSRPGRPGRPGPGNGEDTDLGLRATKAGYRVAFAPDALVWHDVRPSHFVSHLRAIERLDGIVALVSRHPDARELLHAGWFLSSGHKAVLTGWGAGVVLTARPRRWSSWGLAGLAAGLYVWQFGKSHQPPRTRAEWVRSVPLAFVADSYAVGVLARSSVRHRALLL